MPLVTKKFLVCDRCGDSVEVGEAFDAGLATSLPDGWHRIERDRFLCPNCHPGYELMKARR